MANRKQSSDNDFAETAVLPEYLRPDRLEALDDAAAEVHGRYQEYVRSLDEVPVLVDVVQEPRQHADARKTPRSDAVALREQHADNVAARYAEYVEIERALTTTERAPPRHVGARDADEGGAQKKRAKRVKRSARSKS
jgi:hypothetical protein